MKLTNVVLVGANLLVWLIVIPLEVALYYLK